LLQYRAVITPIIINGLLVWSNQKLSECGLQVGDIKRTLLKGTLNGLLVSSIYSEDERDHPPPAVATAYCIGNPGDGTLALAGKDVPGASLVTSEEVVSLKSQKGIETKQKKECARGLLNLALPQSAPADAAEMASAARTLAELCHPR
jgi:hypothetical protein